MIPRNKLDIGWRDLVFGLWSSILRRDRQTVQERLERLWSPNGNALASLSVRSGFDLLLSTLALPEGSEIVVSAVTIRDMVRILESHGLRAVPVDVDLESLAVRPDRLTAAITPRTRAILIAHLFGSRVPMTKVLEIARAHDLYVFEDCAQAFAADGYRGDPECDVAMFSFGPIKTATALGGALLSFRDADLCARARSLQQRCPVQSRLGFLRRVLKYAVLKALSCRAAYSLFVRLCGLWGKTHDQIISQALRGFSGGDLLSKIRRQPCYALLALVERRLRQYQQVQVARRVAAAKFALSFQVAIRPVGADAENHSHWVFPVRSVRPDQLVLHLWQHGFDATQGASSLYAVPPEGKRVGTAREAAGALDEVVYLPVYAGMKPRELKRLVDAVEQFEAADFSLPIASSPDV